MTILGLFCRISSLLQGSFAKETYYFKEPTDRSHRCKRTNVHIQMCMWVKNMCGLIFNICVCYVCHIYICIYIYKYVWTHIQYIRVLCVHIYISVYIYKYVWTHIQYIRVLCVHIHVLCLHIYWIWVPKKICVDSYFVCHTYFFLDSYSIYPCAMCAHTHSSINRASTYGVATISRLLKIIGLLCKRAL